MFKLVRNRPYFFIKFVDTPKEAADARRKITGFGYLSYSEKGRGTRRIGVYASPKGEKVMDWYHFHKGVNFDENRGR